MAQYAAVDLKSYYASAECVDRGLDQSVIFCGQFNTYLSFSFPAPTFSLNPTLPLYLLGANRTILRYARTGDIFNTAHRTVFNG